MGPQPLAERDTGQRYPLRLLECANCALVQLSYIADQREVFPPDHPYSTGNTKALREHFASLAADLAPVVKDGLAVEIGSNDGTFLAALRDSAPQARLLGVEPTGQAGKCAARGIEVIREFFTLDTAYRIRSERGPAALVTASNVLAHVPDPHDFLDGVYALLAEDGVFVTENHDWGSVVNGLQIDTVYHEHARIYSVASLSHLLAKQGFLISDMKRLPLHGGSFRTYAVRQKPNLEVRAEAAAKALRALLDGAVQQGPVYGIGACTRATPLIHYAGIASYLDCICEVPGSDKIGTCMPGTQIPVVDEAKLIADQPPWALLFAWHWTDSIVPALRAKGYQGRIIVPLPAPKVIDG
jgi:hypothetical protein